MNKPTILVTGAGGHVGLPTCLQLLAMGFPVRAFVHRLDHRADQLHKAGAEIFVGDLRDFNDLSKALHGVQRAFHCPPYSDNTLYDNTLFAVAAEQAKLEVIVLMGAWNIDARHPSISQRGHWISHALYRLLPNVDVVHMIPGLFAFPYLLGLPAIVHMGRLMLPFGDGRNAPPSNEDIAACTAAILAEPGPHIGKSYRPTGPRLLSCHQIAEILGKILQRPVRYQNVPFQTFQRAAQAMGYPIEQLAPTRHYAEELRNGAYEIHAPNDVVHSLTGKPAEDFETIARRYIAHPDLINPGLKAGSRLQALALLGKILLTRPIDLDAWERKRGFPLLAEPECAHASSAWRHHAEAGRANLEITDPDNLQTLTT
jgi:uncharacterized protein YbjT (DUF2867 family)